MKALERNAGCRLFDIVGKKLLLTLAGEQLLRHADRILAEMAEARTSLEQLGRWGKGRLRVGAATTACQNILPEVLREFEASFSDYLVSIEPGDTPDLLDLLIHRQIDLALCVDPATEEQLEFHPLFDDDLQFIVGAMHPWARAGKVIHADIPRQRYLHYDRNSVTFRMVNDYFRKDNIVLHTAMEIGDIHASREMVKLGLGISIMAPWVARKEIAEGSIKAFPLGGKKLTRRWGVLHWQSKRLSLPEESFIGFCRSACEVMVNG